MQQVGLNITSKTMDWTTQIQNRRPCHSVGTMIDINASSLSQVEQKLKVLALFVVGNGGEDGSNKDFTKISHLESTTK